MKRTLPPNASLVPAEAELKFSGVIFDVYQWQQKLFDGSFTTFEMLKRPDVIAVIALDEADNVITIDEEQPNGLVRNGSVPVGGAEKTDPSILFAAQREFLEETGLLFSNWRLIAVRQPELKIEFFVHIFAATGLFGEQAQNLDPGEKITVTRTPYQEFRDKDSPQRAQLTAFPTAASLRAFVAANPEGFQIDLSSQQPH